MSDKPGDLAQVLTFPIERVAPAELPGLLAGLESFRELNHEPPVELLDQILSRIAQLEGMPLSKMQAWRRYLAYGSALAGAGGAVVWAGISWRRAA